MTRSRLIATRVLMVVLALGCCRWIVAAEAAPPAESSQPAKSGCYQVAIKMVDVHDGHTNRLRMSVIGTAGAPLEWEMGDDSTPRQYKLTISRVSGLAASDLAQFAVNFQWDEPSPDGAPTKRFAPAITTTVGHLAVVKVGEEKGDRTEFAVMVNEIPAPAGTATTVVNGVTTSAQPTATAGPAPKASAAASASYGTSLMNMVDPRIVIQDEEEKRLGLVAPE